MTTPTDVPDVSAPPPLVRGIKTTEFWAMLIVSVLSLASGLNLIGPDWAKQHEPIVNALAFLAAAVAPGLYSLSRGVTKAGHQQAVATVLAATVNQGFVSNVLVTPTPKPRSRRTSGDSGESILYIIGIVLVIVGAVLLIMAAISGYLNILGLVLLIVGAVLLFARPRTGPGARCW